MAIFPNKPNRHFYENPWIELTLIVGSIALGLGVIWLVTLPDRQREEAKYSTGNILGGIDLGTLTVKKYDIKRTVYLDETGKEVMVIDTTLEIK
jgi:hypothetical protein